MKIPLTNVVNSDRVFCTSSGNFSTVLSSSNFNYNSQGSGKLRYIYHTTYYNFYTNSVALARANKYVHAYHNSLDHELGQLHHRISSIHAFRNLRTGRLPRLHPEQRLTYPLDHGAAR